MLIVPLFILIWKIDKGKIFLICFFGYSVHMISFYISLLGVNMGMWNYPIQLVPLLPSFSLDSSIVPVTFMLAYQWALNKKKNYYIVALAVSIFFSFIFEPILVKMEIFKLYNHITYLHRFILYIVISLVAKFMSNVFLWIQKRGNMST
ncbi:CBO0543 family protein [Cytobacillus sp. Hz8]|uniref:CBO0543 family protein n=1 Tax=Cytobacillus sp. Hz8 TaxID=3347168 RepID=UPI0035D5A3CC